MRPELIDKKLSAFLHDPIDKAIILFGYRKDPTTGKKKIISHKKRAEELSNILEFPLNENDAKGGDRIASAMDRTNISRFLRVTFSKEPEIIHPLSGERLNLKEHSEQPIPEMDCVINIVNRCYDEISKKGLTKEKLYLYLWRKLRDDLKKEPNQTWGNIWDILPADTRMPDHTIWDHLKATCSCSISSYIEKSYIEKRTKHILHNRLCTFIFTIGPVQSFIQDSRKTQDLWMGSYLLSYLNWVAIKTVIEEYGVDSIIYPDLYSQPLADYWLKNELGLEIDDRINTPTIPNKFLAILPQDEIKNIGKKAESAVREEFKQMAQAVFDEVFGICWRTTYANEMLNDQINNFLEIFWVSVPWYSSDTQKADWQYAIEHLRDYFPEKTTKYEEFFNSLKSRKRYTLNIGGLYGLLYDMAESSLGCIKNLRSFVQVKEEGRKCSLCGQRNIIEFDMQKWKELREDKEKIKYIGENEALCAVCLTKRAGNLYFKDFGLSKISFPSTSEVSTASFKQVICKPGLRQDYINYVSNFTNITKHKAIKVDPLPILSSKLQKEDNIDGEWLFPENLTQKTIFDESGIKISDKEIEFLKKKQGDLIKKAGCNPSKYYAIIMMDGDNMGKWLSGELLPELKETIHPKIRNKVLEEYGDLLNDKHIIKPAIHAFISSALRDYSLKMVSKIVEQDHLGKVVYTGGDDILALVNLKDLFGVMVKLRGAFSGHIDGEMKNVNFRQTTCSGYIETNNGYYLTMGSKASASMGVAIAHYKMPLRETLRWAREMEKEAKHIDDNKNAFAIALMKHSGEIRKTVCHWHYDKGNINTVDLMMNLSCVLVDGLSDKFIFNLREEFSRLVDSDFKLFIDVSAFESELTRLMQRASRDKDVKEKAKCLSKRLDDLFRQLNKSPFDNFMGLLEITNAVSKEGDVI